MSQKQLEDLKLFGVNSRLTYLESTEWLIHRLVRTTAAGKPEDIPLDVLVKMQLAADEIDEIKAATDYEKINHLPIKF